MRCLHALLRSTAGPMLAGLLAACGPALDPPPMVADAPATAAAADPEAAAAQPIPVDWSRPSDCLARLRLLRDLVRDGQVPETRPPIAVRLPGPAPGRAWFEPPSVTVIADLPIDLVGAEGRGPAEPPCLIDVGHPGDQQAAHRLIAVEEVPSLYQSSLKSERNPDYDAAQARVRSAERDAKVDMPKVLSVGDPLLDLVGVMVGGFLSGFERGSRDVDLNQALEELAATPRTRDRPIYRPYHFQRSIVRAGKEAVIPIVLYDRTTGQVRRSRVRQRERREFRMLDGLDPRDRDYQFHRQGSVSQQELELWLEGPPELALSVLVEALLEPTAETILVEAPEPAADPPAGTGSATDDPARVAVRPATAASGWPPDGLPSGRADARVVVDLADDAYGRDASGPGPGSANEYPAPEGFAAGDELDDMAGDGPDEMVRLAPTAAARSVGGVEVAGWPTAVGPVPTKTADPHGASVVRIAAGGRTGSGFYVRPDQVLTTSRLVAGAVVADVTMVDGTTVLGVVARTDPLRDLAVVQVPRPGAPVALDRSPAAGTLVIALGEGGDAGLLPVAADGASAPAEAAVSLTEVLAFLKGEPDRSRP